MASNTTEQTGWTSHKSAVVDIAAAATGCVCQAACALGFAQLLSLGASSLRAALGLLTLLMSTRGVACCENSAVGSHVMPNGHPLPTKQEGRAAEFPDPLAKSAAADMSGP